LKGPLLLGKALMKAGGRRATTISRTQTAIFSAGIGDTVPHYFWLQEVAERLLRILFITS
jgi:hypothetical protein